MATGTVDIIERLRASEAANILTNEAAREIERLQTRIREQESQYAILIEKECTIAHANKILAELTDVCKRY